MLSSLALESKGFYGYRIVVYRVHVHSETRWLYGQSTAVQNPYDLYRALVSRHDPIRGPLSRLECRMYGKKSRL